ncbi:pentatricopeptide repeat-containing protein At1g66345, mitochondrial-like [Asparagus officinalis]|nr:pentatricopeptide repeat-containing protein At1g66345, mitochondrial-like [Asparagus officinalis]
MSFIRIPRTLTHNISQSLKPYSSFNLRSSQTLAKQPNSSDFVAPVCNLLAQGANWDTLTSKFPSIQLTETLVEKVLLNLKEPMNAKKALTFFHWSSQDQNFRHGLRSYCIVIHILVHAGLLTDAQALLESCIKKNLASEHSRISVAETILSTYGLALPGPRVFDLLVQTYSKMRTVELAFDACCYLSDHGFCSSLISFNSMLRVAQRSDKNDFAWKVYEYMIERRVYPNQRTVEIMVDVMCKEGSLRTMTDVLSRIRRKNCGPGVIVNLRLALRIFQEGRIEEGVMLLKRLLQKKLILDDVMNSLVIYGYCEMGKLELAYEFYDSMVKRGFSSNAFVHTSFIGAYCKDGRIEKAMRLMEEMESIGLKPYDKTYNFLMGGCSRVGRLDDSLKLHERMLKKGFILDCSACSEIAGKLSEAGEVEKASELLTVLIDKGFVPNEEIYSKLMDGYGKIRKAQEILKIYYEMEHRGLTIGPLVQTSLIRNLCECGDLKEAEKFVNIIKEKSMTLNSCMFDAMIKGCCRKGEIKKALAFYDEMIQKELQPCANTFMILIRSMFEVGNVKCIKMC